MLDAVQASEVFGESFELAHRLLGAHVADAVLHVILDQRPLRGVDDALDRLKLLRQVRARPTFGDQAENAVDLSAHLL